MKYFIMCETEKGEEFFVYPGAFGKYDLSKQPNQFYARTYVYAENYRMQLVKKAKEKYEKGHRPRFYLKRVEDVI